MQKCHWEMLTWARCKKEVCRFKEETKRLAMGSFFSDRIFGKFSKDETIHGSQSFAKFRMSAKRLDTSFQNYFM